MRRAKAGGLPNWEGGLAWVLEALTPGMCLWQALARMAGEELAPLQSDIKTSHLGAPGGWLG